MVRAGKTEWGEEKWENMGFQGAKAREKRKNRKRGVTSVYKEQGREKAETGEKKDKRRRELREKGVYIGTRGRRERLKGR